MNQKALAIRSAIAGITKAGKNDCGSADSLRRSLTAARLAPRSIK